MFSEESTQRLRHKKEVLERLVRKFDPESFKDTLKLHKIWVEIAEQYSQELKITPPVDYRLLRQSWKNKKQYARKKALNRSKKRDPDGEIGESMVEVQTGESFLQPNAEVRIIFTQDPDEVQSEEIICSDTCNFDTPSGEKEPSSKTLEPTVTSPLPDVSSLAERLSSPSKITSIVVEPSKNTNTSKERIPLHSFRHRNTESKSLESHICKLNELELRRASIELKIMEAKERAALADERAALAREQEALLRVQIVKTRLNQVYENGIDNF